VTDTPIRILLVDDHPLVREGMAALLARQGDMNVVAQAADGRAAVELHRKHKPDVTLLDLSLPELEGLEALREIRRQSPEARVIVLTVRRGDEDVYRALQAGARGYLLKDAPWNEILDGIRAVHSGLRRVSAAAAQALTERVPGPGLTEREQQVLALIVAGKGNKAIGADLGIAESTVKAHINSILSKLGVSDRTQAVTAALQRGLAQLD
jgi:DNA-binding NarL/FixJ family response regulator